MGYLFTISNIKGVIQQDRKKTQQQPQPDTVSATSIVM